MFCWEPEEHYHHRLCTVIVPFWFSTEHLWILIVPFWLSTDMAIKGGQLFGPYFQTTKHPHSHGHPLVKKRGGGGGAKREKSEAKKKHCSSGINMCVDSPLPLRTPIFLFLFEWGWSKLKTIACKNQVHIGSRGGIDARTEVEFH